MPQPPPRRLHPKIWRACAGASVQIPALHSRVYYFPQGHLEQASSSPPYLSPLLLSRPLILCRVSFVEFLADPVTDEVFAKLLLHPLNDFTATRDHLNPFGESADAPGDDKVVSFAKILTPSDANNGGGFSVPRYCADSIFPQLNFQLVRPNQTLPVTDVHGFVWEFCHIYRGTPRRHLLTTGWSKFVNHKKLIAGDSVVFMKNSKREMFVGIRRAVRLSVGNGGDYARRFSEIGGLRTTVEEEEQEERYTCFGGFSRNGKGKLSAKAVVDAAESAAQNMPFEVVYYPRAGWSDFVLKEEVVEEALKVVWTPGMRIKMAMETEDSSRMTWFQGTVSWASAPDSGPWRGSPWRMLQIAWDEPEVLQNAKRVSPWQVERISSTPLFHTAFPPSKRFRADHYRGVPVDREEDPLFIMTSVTNSTVGRLNQSLLNYTFPAGMQGARHDLFSVSKFSNFPIDNTHLCTSSSFGNNTVPKLKTVSIDLNIGSSQSDKLSLDSRSSLHSFDTAFVGTHSCNSTKLSTGSFQLFGKIIQMNQPVESGWHGAGCTGDDGNKGCIGTEIIDNPLDHSTYLKLLNRLDVQCCKASTVEAWSLNLTEFITGEGTQAGKKQYSRPCRSNIANIIHMKILSASGWGRIKFDKGN
ncbi:auxin response factor 17 [Senna tora]|uniref:Auxin response factor n=1 Tax=Senna tora TaxID=362788 RepID=A0A834TWH0_9FABA|nr:auxin response factor 17 [Senna tora]